MNVSVEKKWTGLVYGVEKCITQGFIILLENLERICKVRYSEQKLEELFFGCRMFFDYENVTKLGQMMAWLCGGYGNKSEEKHHEGTSTNGEENYFPS